MARKRSQAARSADAVKASIERERAKRADTLKPIEIVKAALSAYLAFTFNEDYADDAAPRLESPDAAGLRRGTQAAVDRLLFNANYWRAAYETRIIAACTHPESARACLDAVSVWTAHTLKLNTLSPDETVATFERFCPPFALNRRRGSHERTRAGKGPLSDFRTTIEQLEQHGEEPSESIADLRFLLQTMEAEAAAYEALNAKSPVALTVLFSILPAWCLQNRIDLVSGPWWDDCDVMSTIIDALHDRFLELGFSDAVCQYFHDSCYEALDAYHRDLSSDPSPFADFDIPQLIALVQQAREDCPNFETDGYGGTLPPWLISKEQLIWNILVCSLYGPASARPLLVDSPDLLSLQGYAGKTDVITELAQTSFMRYTADRIASQADQEFATFASLPADLRDSSIAYISSIHRKLDTLGYEVLPAGSCYPDRWWPPSRPARWNASLFWSIAAGCASGRRPAGATVLPRTWNISAAPTWYRGRSCPTVPRNGTAPPCAASPACWPA
nr:hypothetical protein [Adlercreutzia caecimuris]